MFTDPVAFSVETTLPTRDPKAISSLVPLHTSLTLQVNFIREFVSHSTHTEWQCLAVLKAVLTARVCVWCGLKHTAPLTQSLQTLKWKQFPPHTAQMEGCVRPLTAVERL